MKKQARKEKAPTMAESRERIEKTGLVQLDYIQTDSDTIRAMPDKLIRALHGMNQGDDQIIFPSLGIAIPARYLLKFGPLMGPDAVTLRVDRRVMVMTLEYKPTPDSRSRTEIKGMDAREFEPDERGLTRPEFHARVTSDIVREVKIESWIAKAVSRDDKQPKMKKPYGRFASDGWRIHYDSRLEVELPPDDFCGPELPGMIEQIIEPARKYKNLVMLSAESFLAGVKMVTKANKDQIWLNVNGSLDIYAQTDDESVIRSKITEGYDHKGHNVKFPVNPKFLADALSGLSGKITVRIDSEVMGTHRMYMTDGVREVVLMGQKPE